MKPRYLYVDLLKINSPFAGQIESARHGDFAEDDNFKVQWDTRFDLCGYGSWEQLNDYDKIC
jgi:hypothetical protein